MTWKLSVDSLDPDDLLYQESLFFTGNGYLGVRGNFEEEANTERGTIRGTYINAFHDVSNIPYGEKLYAFPDTQQKMVNIIDAQSIDIFFGEGAEEEKFTLFQGKVLDYERHLHFDRGYTERIIHWQSPQGKEIKLTFIRFVSMVEKELFIQSLTLEPVNFHGLTRIVASVNGDVSDYIDTNDPRVSSEGGKRVIVTDCEHSDMWDYVEVKTSNTQLSAACASFFSLNTDYGYCGYLDQSKATTEVTFTLDKTINFDRKNIFVDTLRHGNDLRKKATERFHDIETLSLEQLYLWQKHFLSDFWSRTDVEIAGDQALQEGIRFNLFHLLQSTGRDGFSNIAAKGLSGEGYEGHYFWDTEIYMFPVFLMTNPELAKQLLLYRYSILDHARGRAKEMGHAQGALFPWRTIAGPECSSYFPAGTAQYHISADIAYSIVQYWIVTKDDAFLNRFGAEILFETARLWLEVGHFKDGQFYIDAVTGPDEYTCIVNNNYYTNAMAKHNLKWAVKVYQRLAQEVLQPLKEKINLAESEVTVWNNAAESMYLPYNKALGINPQDDTFLQKAKWDIAGTPEEKFPLLLNYHPLTLYRYQVCKQADVVLGHFLLEDGESLETIRNSYDYYEQITTHDSSLSCCIFSIMASKLGYRKKAYEYFIETARLDLDNRHGNTKDGLHMANMGGTWLAIVFGFAGLRVKETGISFHPHIPENWEQYAFHIQFHGRRLKIGMSKDDLTFQLISGNPLAIKVYGSDYILDDAKPVSIKPIQATC